jgi:hypothetical protein
MGRALAVVALAGLLAGCGAQQPSTVRAIAVAAGAFGTGAATAAQTCNARTWDECRHVALTGLIIAAGVALSAGAVAFLEAEDERSKESEGDGRRGGQ